MHDSRPAADVSDVLVGGTAVVRDAQLQTGDLDAILAAAEAARGDLMQRAGLADEHASEPWPEVR